MKHTLVLVMLMGFGATAQTGPFELSPPVFKYASGFFASSTSVLILFDQAGATTRYTLDGSEPTASSKVYTGPIKITKSATIKARNFGANFLPSQTASVSVTRMGMPVKSVRFTSPSPSYPGSGPTTLHDGKGGVANHSHPNWLGYSTDTVVFNVETQRAVSANSMVLNIINNEGAWIFPPDSIQVFSGKSAYGKPAATWKSANQTIGQGVQPIRINLPGKRNETHWSVLVFPVRSIPGNHPGKGQRGWFFTDELLIFDK